MKKCKFALLLIFNSINNLQIHICTVGTLEAKQHKEVKEMRKI